MTARAAAVFPWLAASVVAGATAWAMVPQRLGSPAFWLAIGGAYALLSACAGWVLHVNREQLPPGFRLRELLRYRRGDLALGAVVGLALLGLGWGALSVGVPAGSAVRAWVFRLRIATAGLEGSWQTPALFAVVVLEEIVWRAGAQAPFVARWGARNGWVAATLLYAAAHVPSAWATADAQAGVNPLLPLAALSLGAATGALVRFSGRLAPAIVAHGVFSYFGAIWLVR